MNILKRMLSGITALAMSTTICTGIPVQTKAETANSSSQIEQDVDIHANNPLGSLLLAKSEMEQGGQSDGNYGISEIEIENGTAKVSYYAEGSCELILAFYSDDETQMYTSCSQTVSPSESNSGGNSTATLSLPSDVPEYYLLKAYLVSEDFIPLCESYSSSLYTEEITKVRNSTVDDFDEKLVVNLDEKQDTNFLILSEKTIQIEYDGTYNILENYDETTGVYVFSNSNSQISKLSAGNVVYYDYDDQFLVFKIGSITVDGTTATIQSVDMDLSDAFDLAKIEQQSYGEVEDDTADMGDGLTYTGTYAENEFPSYNSRFPLAKATFSGEVTPPKAKYEWELTLGKKNKEGEWELDLGGNDSGNQSNSDKKLNGSFEGEFKGTVNASFEVSIPIKWELYLSTKKCYASIEVTPTVEGEIKIEATLSGTLWFKKVTADFLGLVGAEVKVGAIIEGKISANFKIRIESGFTINLGNEEKKIFNISEPKIECELDLEGSLFIGIIAKASGKIAENEAEATAKAGIEFTVKTAKPHSCNLCFAIKGDLKFSAEVEYSQKKWKWFSKHSEDDSEIKGTITIAEVKIHLYDRYWSVTHNEHGWGECPYMNEQAETTTTALQTTKSESTKATTTTTQSTERETIKIETTTTTVTETTETEGVAYLDQMPIIESDRYTGNEGDSFVYPIGQHQYSRGNTCIDGNSYEHGIEGWIARWNYSEESSWAYSIFELSGKYSTLSGKCELIQSYNTTDFDTTLEFWADDVRIGKYSLTPKKSSFDINLDVSGCSYLKVYFYDNESKCGGTSFGLLGMELQESNGTIKIIDSGICGENLTWTLREDGKLTISGTGDMTDWGNNFSWLTNKDGTQLIDSEENDFSPWYQNKELIKKVIIENGVTSVGKYSFYNCSNLTFIRIPKDIISIGKRAFYGCSKLKSITLPSITTNIWDGAFEGCTGLMSIEIPDNVTIIGKDAFNGCTGLTSIVIPDGVTTIGQDAFEGCSYLTSIVIPESVINIESGAFFNCVRLASITLPKNIINIKAYTFSYCNLGSIIIPDGVENIGSYAFFSCYNLDNIVIPNSVKNIEKKAFDSSEYFIHLCADVYYTGTEEQWKEINIDYDNRYLTNSETDIHYNANISDITLEAANAPITEKLVSIAYNPLAQIDETTETKYEVKEYTYTEAVPETEYLLLIVKDTEAEDILSNDNLVYINQQTADENGVTFRYVVPDGCTYIFIGDFGKGEYCRVVSDEIRTDTSLCTICGSKRLAGDADGNGKINMVDVIKIRKYIVNGKEDNFNENNADVDANGKINMVDVLKVRQYIVNGGNTTL